MDLVDYLSLDFLSKTLNTVKKYKLNGIYTSNIYIQILKFPI